VYSYKLNTIKCATLIEKFTDFMSDGNDSLSVD